MAAVSAGLLMCRFRAGLNFFLVHPGGPFFKNKSHGAWTIPKGLVGESEDRLAAACREFLEETGIEPGGPFHSLGSTRMKSGKEIFAWAFASEWDERTGITSNTFELAWPPRSGKIIHVPEADQGRWMTYDEAVAYIHPSQIVFLDRASSDQASFLPATR